MTSSIIYQIIILLKRTITILIVPVGKSVDIIGIISLEKWYLFHLTEKVNSAIKFRQKIRSTTHERHSTQNS